MANLAFRAVTTVTDTFSGPSVNIAAPTGTVQNDLGIIAYSSFTTNPGGIPTHTTPAGWSLVPVSLTLTNFNTLDYRLSWFYRIEGATPQTETLTSSLTAGHTATRLTYDNPDLVSPYDVITASGGQTFSGTASGVATGIVVAQANELVLMFAQHLSVASTWTEPAGFTERSDTNSEHLSELIAAAGATGNKTAVASNSGSGVVSLIAFKSEGGAARRFILGRH